MRITALAAAVLLTVAAPMAVCRAGDLPSGHPPVGQGPTVGPANHTGDVLEAIPAAGYVYLHVKGADGDEWLAAPANDLKPGAKIRWNDGMIMKNFTSKTLQRTFATIRFVEVAEPAN
jgi:hypothetical protein